MDNGPEPVNKGKRKADEMEDRAEWSFTRCLPVLTDLLRDDTFVKEVRKVSCGSMALMADEEGPGRT